MTTNNDDNRRQTKLYLGLPPIGDPNSDEPPTPWNIWMVEVNDAEDCERYGTWGEQGIGFLNAELTLEEGAEPVLRIFVGDRDENPELEPITQGLLAKYLQFARAA
jgi:hypothetical protein